MFNPHGVPFVPVAFGCTVRSFRATNCKSSATKIYTSAGQRSQSQLIHSFIPLSPMRGRGTQKFWAP